MIYVEGYIFYQITYKVVLVSTSMFSKQKCDNHFT